MEGDEYWRVGRRGTEFDGTVQGDDSAVTTREGRVTDRLLFTPPTVIDVLSTFFLQRRRRLRGNKECLIKFATRCFHYKVWPKENFFGVKSCLDILFLKEVVTDRRNTTEGRLFQSSPAKR